MSKNCGAEVHRSAFTDVNALRKGLVHPRGKGNHAFWADIHAPGAVQILPVEFTRERANLLSRPARTPRPARSPTEPLAISLSPSRAEKQQRRPSGTRNRPPAKSDTGVVSKIGRNAASRNAPCPRAAGCPTAPAMTEAQNFRTVSRLNLLAPDWSFASVAAKEIRNHEPDTTAKGGRFLTDVNASDEVYASADDTAIRKPYRRESQPRPDVLARHPAGDGNPLFCLVFGIAFGLFSQAGVVLFLAPVAVLAGLCIWALPEHARRLRARLRYCSLLSSSPSASGRTIWRSP